jgi:hypothetical protein
VAGRLPKRPEAAAREEEPAAAEPEAVEEEEQPAAAEPEAVAEEPEAVAEEPEAVAVEEQLQLPADLPRRSEREGSAGDRAAPL